MLKRLLNPTGNLHLWIFRIFGNTSRFERNWNHFINLNIDIIIMKNNCNLHIYFTNFFNTHLGTIQNSFVNFLSLWIIIVDLKTIPITKLFNLAKQKQNTAENIKFTNELTQCQKLLTYWKLCYTKFVKIKTPTWVNFHNLCLMKQAIN